MPRIEGGLKEMNMILNICIYGSHIVLNFVIYKDK